MQTTLNTKPIKDYMQAHNLTAPEFCKICKIHSTTLDKIFKDDLDFEVEALIKIAKLLKLPLTAFF